VPGLAATLAEIKAHPVWRTPEINRKLVERATHEERLDEIARENGWEDYRARVTGKAIAETKGAELVTLRRDKPFPDAFHKDEAVRTRLGAGGALLKFPDRTTGPFGEPVKSIALPAHWSDGLIGDERIEIVEQVPLTLQVGKKRFVYDTSGLQRMETQGE